MQNSILNYKRNSIQLVQLQPEIINVDDILKYIFILPNFILVL